MASRRGGPEGPPGLQTWPGGFFNRPGSQTIVPQRRRSCRHSKPRKAGGGQLNLPGGPVPRFAASTRGHFNRVRCITLCRPIQYFDDYPRDNMNASMNEAALPDKLQIASFRLPSSQLAQLGQLAHRESLRRGKDISRSDLVREVVREHLLGGGAPEQAQQTAVTR